MLRTRDRIIYRLKANKVVKNRIKFGVMVPKIINHTMELDQVMATISGKSPLTKILKNQSRISISK